MKTLPVNIEQALFPAECWETLVNLAPELSHAYAARQIFRTETEARVSVLDDIHYPTKASKYWQALREQMVMLEQLVLASFEYRRNEVQLRRLRATLDTSQDEFEIDDAQINFDECLFKQAGMRTVAADRAREIGMWSMLKAELNDGSFDTDNVDSHQLVSYTTQFALRAAHANPATMSSTANTCGLITGCRNDSLVSRYRRN